jgi:hypothetical protein
MISILPNGQLPIQIDSAFTFMASSFSKANVLFPLDTVITMLGIVFVIETALLTFKFANFAYNKLRGAG